MACRWLLPLDAGSSVAGGRRPYSNRVALSRLSDDVFQGDDGWVNAWMLSAHETNCKRLAAPTVVWTDWRLAVEARERAGRIRRRVLNG